MSPERHRRVGNASRERFSGRRYNVLRGLWIAFEDAPGAAVVRGLAALAAGAATGPLLVLATERFIATAACTSSSAALPITADAPSICPRRCCRGATRPPSEPCSATRAT